MLSGQLREVEEEEGPGLAELAGVVQSLRALPRMGRLQDRQPVHDLGGCIAVAQATLPPRRDRPAAPRAPRSWMRPRMSAVSRPVSEAATPSGRDDRLSPRRSGATTRKPPPRAVRSPTASRTELGQAIQQNDQRPSPASTYCHLTSPTSASPHHAHRPAVLAPAVGSAHSLRWCGPGW
jgi:hypothetical protein